MSFYYFLRFKSGHAYARGVETCLRFRGRLCTRGRNMTQIQDRFMHGGQKHASDSGQTYARGVETCLRFRADLCTGCRNMPQIQGKFMHPVQNLLPVFRRFFELWRRGHHQRRRWRCPYNSVKQKRLFMFFI